MYLCDQLNVIVFRLLQVDHAIIHISALPLLMPAEHGHRGLIDLALPETNVW